MRTKNHFVFSVSVLLFIILQDSSCFWRSKLKRVDPRDSELNFTQLAGKYGYETEEHPVVTEDGYILTIFRMRARQCEGKRLPVLMMHGLLASSDAFLDAGPKAATAYFLADACYDVWVGNSRGNYYARAHITLNPDKDAEFWNFSYEQMGYYDNPATIDYILNKTGYEKVSYIGYSQGSAVGFVMCSERPGYCDKLNIFINLAPSTRHLKTKSRLTRASAIFIMKHEPAFVKAGIYKIPGRPDSMKTLINTFCHSKVGEATFRSFIALADSYHRKSMSSSAARSICGHFTAGTSIHNIAHYGQAMLSDKFQKFDYGSDNFKIYGSEDPPSYKLEATTAPVLIMYGENDGLSDPIDARWLASQLPNLVEAWLVPDPKWNHLDFGLSRHAPKLIHPKIQKYLQKYSK